MLRTRRHHDCLQLCGQSYTPHNNAKIPLIDAQVFNPHSFFSFLFFSYCLVLKKQPKKNYICIFSVSFFDVFLFFVVVFFEIFFSNKNILPQIQDIDEFSKLFFSNSLKSRAQYSCGTANFAIFRNFPQLFQFPTSSRNF